ncbi:proteoglycan 4-like [Camponotus floridanus]|uniref:proteoglycan 4-like n=1 Tax=Camponotus floridanus TaxID=104421 RepID=UPI000DC6B3FA|nr:proteoglycan 4-like [Camponotus floridanus]
MMNTRRSEPRERIRNVLSPLVSAKGREANSEVNRRKSTSTTVPTATATMQKSTESKTPSTKYDGDNMTATMQRATMTEPMSSGATTATTYENIKENVHTDMKRINQVVRREVAKERKKIKREEFLRRKAKYTTRIPPIPAPPVYVAPSPIPTSLYVPTYAPSTYAAPFTCAPPTYAAPAHPQPPPYAAPAYPQPPAYAAPAHPQPPPYAAPAYPQPPAYAAPAHPQPLPYGTPNVIISPYGHVYRPHF